MQIQKKECKEDKNDYQDGGERKRWWENEAHRLDSAASDHHCPACRRLRGANE
jgi:hypothetical protein